MIDIDIKTTSRKSEVSHLDATPNSKLTEVIIIVKPGKPKNESSSCKPICLLPILLKQFKKLLLKRLKPIIKEGNLVPVYKFGSRGSYFLEKALEGKKVC